MLKPWKILLFAIVFFTVNELMISNKIFRAKPRSQRDQNLSKLENYLFEQKVKKNVLCGTSLTALLSFPPNIFANLALSGESTFTCLDFLKKSGKIPVNLVIETTIMDKHDINKEIVNKVTGKTSIQIKSFLNSVRISYKPLDMISEIPQNLMISKRKNLNKKHMNDSGYPTNNEKMKDLRKKQIKKNMAPKNQILTKSELTLINAKIRIYTDYFAKRGANIVFLEMPLDPEMKYAKRPIQIRENIISNFNYKYILPRYQNIRTKDGYHLDTRSAQIYQEYLVNIINNLARIK
jgi:hypothetical protein